MFRVSCTSTCRISLPIFLVRLTSELAEMEESVYVAESAPEQRRKPRKLADDKFARVPDLYFDLLPDNANENIVQYMSAKPYAKKWQRFLSKNDTASLYGFDGDLGRAARLLIDTMKVYREHGGSKSARRLM